MNESSKVNVSTGSSAQGIRRVALSLLVAAAGTLAVSAWAHGHGPRGGGAEMGSPGMFMGHGGHMGRGLDRMLDSVNATDAQRAQIKQIAQAAAADMKSQHEASRGMREQGLALFTAPVVDARAVENLRQQRLAQHDASSKRMTQALLDISAVLTPEQRVKLGERMKQRAEHMQERMQRRGAASGPAN